MARLIRERADVVPLLAELFRIHGFEGASLTRISAATKLGKGSLYHFFPGGKEEMAAAVLAHVDAWFETHVYAQLRAPGAALPAIEAMFASTDDYFRGGGRVCLVGLFALDSVRDRFAGAINDYFRRWIEALAEALSRAGHPDAQAEAEEVVSGIQGALVLARALDNPAAFSKALARMAARLTSAMPSGV